MSDEQEGKTLEEKFSRVLEFYKGATSRYATLSRGVPTTLRDKEMREVQANILEYVDALGYLLEKGDIPYGREVGKVLFTAPDYQPSSSILEVAARGLAMSYRLGYLTINLKEGE